MAAKRHERTYARKQAIQVLYQAEILDRAPYVLLEDESSFIDSVKPSEYALRMLDGINDNLDALDSMIDQYSENWAIDRMPAVDRAILRLACYEMAFVNEVPVSVAINEAVDLAKEFGGEDESPRFVNGVLGRIAVYLEEHGGAFPGAADAPAAAPEDGSAEKEADEEADGEDAADESAVSPDDEAASEGGR